MKLLCVLILIFKETEAQRGQGMCGQQLCRDLTPVYIYLAALQGSGYKRGHLTPFLSLVQLGHGFASPRRGVKWGGIAPCLQSPELWPEITEAHSRL